MASPDASSSPTFPLLALPGEIQNAIVACLDFPELYILRLTNRYFYALIPRIPSGRLLQIEEEFMRDEFYACLECERLRPYSEFNHGMLFSKGSRSKSAQRCRECVCRNTYEPGSRWEEYLVPFVWCLKCNKIAEAPVDTRVTQCLSCNKSTQKRKRTQRTQRSRMIEAARRIKLTEERKSKKIEAARRNKSTQERHSRRIRRSKMIEAAIV